ncbi:MAG: hypothetical protein LKM36_11565 [Flavobacteriales bacterium]|nr:hypothetical protein [Flavobacteriales bacterium]
MNNAGFEDLATPVVTWDQLEQGHRLDPTPTTAPPTSSYQGCPHEHRGHSRRVKWAPAMRQPSKGEHFAGFVAYKDELRPNLKRIWPAPKRTTGAFPTSNTRSTSQTALNGALTAGQKYDVTFRVKLANGSDRAVSGIGAYLSPTCS